jgi:Ca2+-binding EF-hand superfamily protein
MNHHHRTWLAKCCPAGVRIGPLAQIVTACSVLAWVAPSEIVAAPTPADAALFARLDGNKDNQLTAAETPSEHRRLFERLLRKADANGDKSLSRDEFLSGLENDQPEKPIEEKQPSELPGADAIRWMLLSMDTDRDGSITAGEVPESLRTTFQSLLGPIDRDQSGALERNELSQGGRQLSNIATRVAQQMQVDVAAELAKLRASQGAAFERFEGRRGGPRGMGPGMEMDNPRQARQLFQQWDANGDGQVAAAEVPEAQRGTFRQLLQQADRDRNGRLSEQEFLAVSRQLNGRRGGRGRRGPAPVLEALRGAGGANSPGNSAEGDAMEAMPGGGK